MERILGKGYVKNTFYLHILATHPDHQGKGIGSALVRHVTKEVFQFKDIFDDRRTKEDVVVFWKLQNITLMFLFMNISDLS
jgi:GNAT superfamily N-acetyltransferase